MATPTLVCVWLAVCGQYTPPRGQLMLGENGVLVGLGVQQLTAQKGSSWLPKHTIGELRADYDLRDELPTSLADDRECWLYTDDNATTMVFVEAHL